MRKNPRSRASASSPPDALGLALAWLGQRELSEAQLRTRLARRGCAADDIEAVVARLTADRTLDDRRAARAAARLEAVIRRRGPGRVRQRLQAMGLPADIADAAVDDVFGDVDADALLEAALTRRLRGRAVSDLDDKAHARLVRGLVGQGFALSAVLQRLRRA